MNRVAQTYLDKMTLTSRWQYPKFLNVICSRFPEKSDALILGLGGGTVANIFKNQLGFNVDAVELTSVSRKSRGNSSR